MSADDAKKRGDLGDYHGLVHEYDGIIELDNQLPRWWLLTLFGAVAFAAGYWLYYHSYQRDDLPLAAYNRQKAAELAAEAEQLKLAGEVTPELLTKLSHDPATVEQGKAVFAEVCVTCHADGGRGNIGPNLTDDYWLHGHEPLAVYGTIRNGFLPKQMPAWGKTLGEARVRAVAAFVLTIQGTNVAGGKAPQGDKI
ncbi:MAG: c-type cytochrome [Myxococcales bacterium]|nr:c-type cytochrome [Myxococcales bacterium]